MVGKDPSDDPFETQGPDDEAEAEAEADWEDLPPKYRYSCWDNKTACSLGLGEVPDPTTRFAHHYKRFDDLSDFTFTMGVFAHLYGLSGRSYKTLRDILGLLVASNCPSWEVENLPRQLSTLKKTVRQRLPLVPTRRSRVALRPEKMPSYAEQQKGGSAVNRKRRRVEIGRDQAELTLLDPITMLRNFLSSDASRAMHRGMAHLVDTPTEVYHSRSGAASVRTTLGQFARATSDGSVQPSDESAATSRLILPSDSVLFSCLRQSCPCGNDSNPRPHTG